MVCSDDDDDDDGGGGGSCGSGGGGGGGVDAEATDAGVDEALGVKSSGAPIPGGLLLFSLPLYRCIGGDLI